MHSNDGIFLFCDKAYCILSNPSKLAKGELIIKLDSRSKQLMSSPINKRESKLVVPRFGIKELDNILENLRVTEILEISPDIFLIRMPLDTELNTAKEKILNSGWIEDVDFNYMRFVS